MTPSRTGPLRRRTLADDVHGALRTAIVDGSRAAGERLTIDALARDLAVSATPVREALARLATEGLAVYEPLVGYRVAPPLDTEAVDRLMEARVLLEPRVARLAAERRTEEDLHALDRGVLAAAESDEGGAGRLAADRSFHGWVAGCAHNPFLADALADLRPHVHLHRSTRSPADQAQTDAEHRAIHEAVAAGDGAAAGAAMAAHLDRARGRHETAVARS